MSGLTMLVTLRRERQVSALARSRVRRVRGRGERRCGRRRRGAALVRRVDGRVRWDVHGDDVRRRFGHGGRVAMSTHGDGGDERDG